MATLKDIARETGLDFRSVSHVLHRNDTRYSAETRRRVQEAPGPVSRKNRTPSA